MLSGRSNDIPFVQVNSNRNRPHNVLGDSRANSQHCSYCHIYYPKVRSSIIMKRREFIGAGAAVGIGTLAGCLGWAGSTGGEVTETVSRSFGAPAVQEIHVRNEIGNVLITAQGTGGVDVRVLKRSVRGQAGLDDLTVGIDLADGTLILDTSLDGRALISTRQTPTTDVTITVPETRGPEIATITSGFGDVTLLGTCGDTVVRTDIGNVIASGVDGYLSLSSRTGTILSSDVAGLTAVSTEIGSIKADLNGVRDDIEISTDIGDVTLGIADDLDLDILTETNGSFDSNLPVTDSRTAGTRFTGRLNDGGHQLRAVSNLGDISLRSVTRDRS